MDELDDISPEATRIGDVGTDLWFIVPRTSRVAGEEKRALYLAAFARHASEVVPPAATSA